MEEGRGTNERCGLIKELKKTEAREINRNRIMDE